MVDIAGRSLPLDHLRGESARAPAIDADLAALSPEWMDRYAAFSAGRPHGTAQDPLWVAAWSRHAAPDMVALTLSWRGAPWLMLPLAVSRRGPFTVARFPGGSHANANFPAFDLGLAARLDRFARRDLLRAVRRARPDIDLLLWERMAPELAGAANPLLALGGSPAPNPALSLPLEGGFEAVLKRSGDRRKAKKHRSHARRYEEAGGFRRIEARSEAEIDRLLGSFLLFKKARFAKSGIPDVFAEPGVQDAFRALFLDALGKADPPFLLHGLEVGGTLRAVTGSSSQGNAITCEFGAIREDELSHYSPGEFLFHWNIREACEGGRGFYDFGVGDERYKRLWGGIETDHFDVAVPVSAKGRLIRFGLGWTARLKSAVKRNPALWALVKRLRREAAGGPVREEKEVDTGN